MKKKLGRVKNKRINRRKKTTMDRNRRKLEKTIKNNKRAQKILGQ